MRVLYFCFAILLLSYHVNAEIFEFNFSSVDIDGDEIYGYFVLLDGPKIKVEEIKNYTTDILSDGSLERTFYINKDLMGGYYRYDIEVSDVPIEDFSFLEQKAKNEEIIYDWVDYAPQLSIVSSFYVEPNDDIFLEERIIYKNVIDKELKLFPIRDPSFGKRTCLNPMYFKSDLSLVNVSSVSEDSKPILARWDIPPGGERVLILKCKIDDRYFGVNPATNGDKEFKLRMDFYDVNLGRKDISIEGYTKRIYFKKERHLISEFEHTFVSPTIIPVDYGDYIVFEYIDDLRGKTAMTSEYRIIYRYNLKVKELLFYIIVTVIISSLLTYLLQGFYNKLLNTKKIKK